MTGWQTAERHGPSLLPHHQEAMEFSRAITQLATANQQLATAHTATLAHLEELYRELRNERERRLRRGGAERAGEGGGEGFGAEGDGGRGRGPGEALLEDTPRKRPATERTNDDVEERHKLELRIDRLENLLTDNCDYSQGRQRNSRQEEEKKLRSRIDRLDSKESDDRRECATDRQEGSMNRREPVADRRINDADAGSGRVPSIDLPERDFKCQRASDAIGDEYRTSSIHRIRSDDGTPDETDRSMLDLHLVERDSGGGCPMDEEEQTLGTEVNKLSEEIARLKAERLEYHCANERLRGELDEQRAAVEKLTEDNQTLKSTNEEMQSILNDRREECDALAAKFSAATSETKTLLERIDGLNADKDTAVARISDLEQDLQKSLLEKEQIKSIESQKTLKLKAQLAEEVADKKKQIKALEDALDEIQRLKETIKTEKKDDDDDDEASKGDIDSIDPIDTSQESPPIERATTIEEFKKDLMLKREARQRAIAAVSSEMERLRRELDAEKEAHSETSRVLDLLRSAQNDSESEGQAGKVDGWRSRFRDPKPDEQDLAMKRVEAQRITYVLKVSDELRNDVRFQIEKVDDLRYHLETEPDQHRHRIRSLADMTNNTREALHARESRANELKGHLAQILVRLGDRSFLELKDGVGLECERQLENINSLKCLYNERLKVLTELKDAATKELADVKSRLNHSLKKTECLEEDLRKADEKIDVQDTEISNLESQLGLTKADCRDLQNQMSLINGLFTQILLGASSADMDLDRLTQLLQENHDLISDIAREESTEAAALPKLLLDLVEQVEGGKGSQKRVEGEHGVESEAEKKDEDLQQEEIAHNLPKVWRVLLELLSCHAEGAQTSPIAPSADPDPNSCYKSVDTPAGPRLVISVSKTYIRLKELILEKKHLEKEMNRMKQLNTHLESKLGEQEKRLSTVSAELSKTWTIVDRMQAQHQQLHTHERILRYELQQKRKMLQELKQELEYCREKWESARQKNTNTELEWRSLRREFAARKALAVHDSFSNSAESGFSDERGDDTDEEEDNSVEERIRLGPRRRPRKESPRAPSPDTESEQPTDTELSEPKTSSSTTLEQRTPSPETEAELDEVEVAEIVPNTEVEDAVEVSQLISENTQESLDTLDLALTNVIQNLIDINDSNAAPSNFEHSVAEAATKEIALEKDCVLSSIIEEPTKEPSITEEPTKEPSITEESTKEPSITEEPTIEPSITETQSLELLKSINDTLDERVEVSTTEQEEDLCPSPENDFQHPSEADGEKEEPPSSPVSHIPAEASPASTRPVFSIGPFPPSTAAPAAVKIVQFSEPLVVGPSNPFSAPVFGAPLPDTDDRFDAAFSSSIPASCQEPRSLEKRTTRSMESVIDSDSVSVDSSSSLDTVKEFPAVDAVVVKSPSSSSVEAERKESVETLKRDEASRKAETKPTKTRTPEEALAAREDRLKRLEEQAKWLMNKMNATSRRGSALSTRLEELHEAYGEPPVPPPMPDVLPSQRLRTNLADLPRQVPESSATEATENTRKPVSDNSSNESSPSKAP
ncbi:uncharacterized protein LOC144471105 [Augochlora pura]